MSVENKILNLNKQLYPTGRAWNFIKGSDDSSIVTDIFTDGVGNNFVDGVGNDFVQTTGQNISDSKKTIIAELQSIIRFYNDAISILDITIPDNDNFSDTDADNWERVLALFNSNLTLEERKEAINRKASYPNGIPERAHYTFIESQLQANGFNVFIRENRFADGSGGWLVEDPDDTASKPEQMGLTVMGIGKMGGQIAGLDYTICANYIDESLDSTYFDIIFSQNQMGVGVMGIAKMEKVTALEREQQLRYTFFVGGSSYPSAVSVPLNRKDEFRELILKLKPAHSVAFLYINYV